MVASQYLKTLQRCFVHEQKSLSLEQEVVLTKFFRAALPLSSYTFVNQEFTVGCLPCAKKLTPKIVPACMRRINETRPRVGERYPVTLTDCSKAERSSPLLIPGAGLEAVLGVKLARGQRWVPWKGRNGRLLCDKPSTKWLAWVPM